MKKIILASLFALLYLGAYAQVINESQVPANIKTTATAKVPAGNKISWVLDKNRKKYIASVMSTTLMRMVEVGFDGKWLGTTDGVLPDKMPAAVMATIKKTYVDKGYEASNFFYVEEPGVSPYYTIDLSSEDEDLQLKLDKAGKILATEAQ